MRTVFPKAAMIASASMLAMITPATAQTTPGGTMTPPGDMPPQSETAPAEPAPQQQPHAAPSESANATDQTPISADPAQTVAANVVAADRLSMLESAVAAAGLAEVLAGAGPFTVFAPDNGAFGLVRADALQSLMQPANRSQLANLLQAHVVSGRVTAADLLAQIETGGGSATLQTIGGDQLTATRAGDGVMLTGAHGSRAYVTQADAGASNGVIHIVNGVLLPAD